MRRIDKERDRHTERSTRRERPRPVVIILHQDRFGSDRSEWTEEAKSFYCIINSIWSSDVIASQPSTPRKQEKTIDRSILHGEMEKNKKNRLRCRHLIPGSRSNETATASILLRLLSRGRERESRQGMMSILVPGDRDPAQD